MSMNMRFPIFPLLLFLILSAGTLCAQSRGSRQDQVRSKDAARYYEELIGNLTRQVKFLQDENASLSAKVSELERATAAVRAENHALKTELESIRKQIVSDAAERDRQLKSLSVQLEKIAKLPPPVKTEIQPKSSGNEAASPRGGRYEEYTVQPGATLSAIARAYGTTVNEIKKANDLKNDFLRVGQKLLIPLP